MPKEHKRRGRREEQKKKRKREQDDPEAAPKRRRTSLEIGHEPTVDDQAPPPPPPQDDAVEGVPRPEAMPFYGMLDDDEQEYFKRADEMLELNQFDGPDERSLFIESVWKEASGKELKIANSQSCSRLMERLILLSSPSQLKDLFQKFSGQQVFHAPYLVFPALTMTALCTSCSTDSLRIAARLSSYKPHLSSRKKSPSPTSYTRRYRPILITSSFPWRTCFYTHSMSWRDIWAISLPSDLHRMSCAYS